MTTRAIRSQSNESYRLKHLYLFLDDIRYSVDKNLYSAIDTDIDTVINNITGFFGGARKNKRWSIHDLLNILKMCLVTKQNACLLYVFIFLEFRNV